MKWLHPGFAALALWGCSDGPLAAANDMQAAEAIRECRITAHWWFGPLYGFGHGPAVAIRLRGLSESEFGDAANCLKRSLRRRGLDSDVENADAPDPEEIWIDGNGMRVAPPPRPRREAPEPVWRDMNGRPVGAGGERPPGNAQ
jgi:hypothetical protein